MYWFILFIAGIFEAGWVVCIQKSESFSKIPYILLAILSMTISLLLFTVAIKKIPTTQAYMVWIAFGVVSIAVINHVFFSQILSKHQLFYLGIIFIGILGLKVSS